MKRIALGIMLALALGGTALAVAQEPNQPTDQPATVPYPEQAATQAKLSPLAAEVDEAIKATLDRAGRSAVAAEAKPIADATATDCLLADEHQNIQVLLTKECVAEVKSQLAEVEREQPSEADARPEADSQRP